MRSVLLGTVAVAAAFGPAPGRVPVSRRVISMNSATPGQPGKGVAPLGADGVHQNVEENKPTAKSRWSPPVGYGPNRMQQNILPQEVSQAPESVPASLAAARQAAP